MGEGDQERALRLERKPLQRQRVAHLARGCDLKEARPDVRPRSATVEKRGRPTDTGKRLQEPAQVVLGRGRKGDRPRDADVEAVADAAIQSGVHGVRQRMPGTRRVGADARKAIDRAHEFADFCIQLIVGNGLGRHRPRLYE
jgi:hypothetical protein